MEFAYPVWKGGEGCHDNEGSGDFHCLKVGNEGDDLDCFSVGEYGQYEWQGKQKKCEDQDLL